LADAKLHGHKYAIDVVLALIAQQQKAQVGVFASAVDDMEQLVPDAIVVKKVRPGPRSLSSGLIRLRPEAFRRSLLICSAAGQDALDPTRTPR
jgi:hypothetical protein